MPIIIMITIQDTAIMIGDHDDDIWFNYVIQDTAIMIVDDDDNHDNQPY